jgi:hypothetical protein
MPAEETIVQNLCLTCGLCCNGVIFADVQLQPDDDKMNLKSLGLPLTRNGNKTRFPQPCMAFQECRCRIYGDRPEHCREFECALLKNVNAGLIGLVNAQKIIHTAQRRAEKVRQLLRALGDQDEQLALSVRFRKTSKRMHASSVNDETADLFGDLTLAMHDLNVLLASAFYPGRIEG